MAATTRLIKTAATAVLVEKGPVAMTYVDVARRAGVSIPTVYKHFPRHADLLRDCEAAIEAAAPHAGEAAILGEEHLDRRLGLLVDGLFAQHAYFAPWRRWSAPAASPHEDLIRAALAPAFNGKVPRPPLAVAVALLGFGSWQALSRMLPDAAAVNRAATGALRALFSRRDSTS
jgi:AcrR family transcriptional regulator